MKRLPVIVSFIAVVALSVSLAYWAMQLFRMPQRPIDAAAIQDRPPASLDAAGGLFGGQATGAAISAYQLRGVVAAANGSGSVAILAVDNKPSQALAVGATVAPGVTVKEVDPRYVLLLDGGVVKRLELVVAVSKGGAVAPMAPLPQVQPVPQAQPVESPQSPQPPQPEPEPEPAVRPNPQVPSVEPQQPLPPQAPPTGRMGMGARQVQR